MAYRFNLIGVCCGERYNIDDIVVGGDGKLVEGLGHIPRTEYEAFGMAKGICRYADVPDGSSFRHYFERVYVYKDGDCIGYTNGYDLYRR